MYPLIATATVGVTATLSHGTAVIAPTVVGVAPNADVIR